MSRTDYHDFHEMDIDCIKKDGLWFFPSIRKSGLSDLYFRCCKESVDNPCKVVVLEVSFYCDDPERLADG